MTVYMGRPGDLVAIPSPLRGVDATRSYRTTTHELLSGARVVDRSPVGARSYAMEWRQLKPDAWAVLEELANGYRGPGPFVLLDPLRVNHLAPSQASGTDVTQDTTGWQFDDDSETIASTQAQAYRGHRSLLWTLPAAPVSGVLTLQSPHPSLLGYPTPADAVWTFSVYLRRGTGATGAELAAAITWIDDASTVVAEAIGAPIVVDGTSWVRATVTATAPTGAVYAVPRIVATAATITAETQVYVDAPQFEMGVAASTWRPGTGVPLVTIVELSETYPRNDYRDASATLVEVGGA